MENIKLTDLADAFGANSALDKDNILWRKVDSQWIGKPGIQVKPSGKGFQMKWREDIMPEDIICNGK